MFHLSIDNFLDHAMPPSTSASRNRCLLGGDSPFQRWLPWWYKFVTYDRERESLGTKSWILERRKANDNIVSYKTFVLEIISAISLTVCTDRGPLDVCPASPTSWERRYILCVPLVLFQLRGRQGGAAWHGDKFGNGNFEYTEWSGWRIWRWHSWLETLGQRILSLESPAIFWY